MKAPRRARLLLLIATLQLLAATGPAVAQMPAIVEPPGPAELLKSQRQREQIGLLARRRLGVTLHEGAVSDLDVLQRLLDEGAVAPDDEFGQQSLGVVLGDVMARNLGLEWVVVDDELGRSRALRYRETSSLFFPVTMISKRARHDERIVVRALYDDVARGVERLEQRRNPKRRAIPLPPRPGPGEVEVEADR
jgi:hypothetical protein